MSVDIERGEWGKETLPPGWCWVEFGDFWSDHTDAKRKLPQNLYVKEGAYAVVDQGADMIGGYTDDASKQSLAPLPAIIFGDHTRIVKYINHPFVQGADGVRVLCAARGLEPLFAYHALRRVKLPDKGYSRHSKFLKATLFPVAPLLEQRRIVAKIDNLSANSKRARDQLNHVPRLVEKYKQAILAAAFRGDLTRDWRATYCSGGDSVEAREQVQAKRDAKRIEMGLRAKGRNRSVPARVVGLPKLPSGWEWLIFDDCAWDLTVGHVGPMKDRYVNIGIPFLRSLNVRPNRVDLSNVVHIDENFHRELAKSQLKPGDLVVVRTGEPGVAAVVPLEIKFANCSDLVICRLVASMSPSYAAFYMNSEFAKNAVRNFQVGVAQQHFNVGAMSEMPVPFASAKEQTEIVRRIETAFGWIDRLASDASSARRLIDHLDQAVLAKAFQGELVPQDPNDEPASVLLERIRAERANEPSMTGKRARFSAT